MKLNRDRVLVGIGILVNIAIALFQLFVENETYKFNLVVILSVILFCYVLFLYLIADAEVSLRRALDSKLPTIEYLASYQDVVFELRRSAEKADNFIIATGGNSMARDYLKV